MGKNYAVKLLSALFIFLVCSCGDREVPKKASLNKRSPVSEDYIKHTEVGSLKFGFDLRLGPKDDVRIYLPFLRYLEQNTGNRFSIRFTEKYEDTVPTDAAVLIKGESGTGKELIARAIYHYSNRSSKPFLAINCAAISEQLLESELFGYERGAFTGADFKRIGKSEQYSGGTIFLDEIGDMPLGLQAKLLRVLQDGKFQRLGGTETIETNVRIIAATNKDIEDMVKNSTFREDLYYRTNVVTINVPPLRERREDIKELVHYFIQKYNKKLGKTIKGITADALKKLKEHPWHGNVRELENIIQKTIVFCNSDYLSMECCEGLRAQNLLRNSCASLEEVIQNVVELAFAVSEQTPKIKTSIYQRIVTGIVIALLFQIPHERRGLLCQKVCIAC